MKQSQAKPNASPLRCTGGRLRPRSASDRNSGESSSSGHLWNVVGPQPVRPRAEHDESRYNEVAGEFFGNEELVHEPASAPNRQSQGKHQSGKPPHYAQYALAQSSVYARGTKSPAKREDRAEAPRAMSAKPESVIGEPVGLVTEQAFRIGPITWPPL